MKKIRSLEDFIPKDLDNLELKCILWSYNVHSDARQWNTVLVDKWRLLDHEQRGI